MSLPGSIRRGAIVLGLAFALITPSLCADNQPGVTVANSEVGPRTLEPLTRTAVIRDYLAAWQSLSQAFDRDNSSQLSAAFIGIALNKLSGTIAEQEKLGLRTHYQDLTHHIRLTFYSPEGLSIQLLDNVEYDLQLFDHDKLQATHHVQAQYVAVLTPTEVRWKVRVLQATPE